MDEIDQLMETERAIFEANLASVTSKVKGISNPTDKLGPEFCHECGDEIPMGRRKAAPWSVLCRDCQEAHERG